MAPLCRPGCYKGPETVVPGHPTRRFNVVSRQEGTSQARISPSDRRRPPRADPDVSSTVRQCFRTRQEGRPGAGKTPILSDLRRRRRPTDARHHPHLTHPDLGGRPAGRALSRQGSSVGADVVPVASNPRRARKYTWLATEAAINPERLSHPCDRAARGDVGSATSPPCSPSDCRAAAAISATTSACVRLEHPAHQRLELVAGGPGRRTPAKRSSHQPEQGQHATATLSLLVATPPLPSRHW